MTKKRDHYSSMNLCFFLCYSKCKDNCGFAHGRVMEYLSKEKIIIAKEKRRKERIVQLLRYIIGNFGAF